MFISSREINTVTIYLPKVRAADSAATVRVEAQGTAELVWAAMDSLAWVLIRQSLLLQWFAVNLINANKAADKIPIFLICESAIVCRPGEIARRLWMIRIVDEIVINPGIRRRRFQFINQNRVIDAEAGISRKKCDKQFASRQSGI